MSRLLVEPLPRLRVGGISDGTCEQSTEREKQHEADEVTSGNVIEVSEL